MERIAFKMKLLPGKAQEYKDRHDRIWPELSALLKEAGISDYSIYLDEETRILFAIQTTADPAALDRLPRHPVMQKWWKYMADVMESHPDHSPVSAPLQEMFHLP